MGKVDAMAALPHLNERIGSLIDRLSGAAREFEDRNDRIMGCVPTPGEQASMRDQMPAEPNGMLTEVNISLDALSSQIHRIEQAVARQRDLA
ncbi:hypothetical protein [Sphingobium yanoikuyae]|uniref:hypothetical protein n=1 Tax=Sphingobium yanoikuyae TaxID=13690 RepID=UPI00056A99B3|nr:hypothetical protein [Sphingobium yanoikuyae]MDV3479871.1 hypothetical protein [Sphingobium yanoikuyae]